MSELRQIIKEVMPLLYENDRMRSGAHPQSEASRSNRCHFMTLELFNVLNGRGIVCRRELHQLDDKWHYLIAHAAPDATPTQQDAITDVNPWGFEGSPGLRGHLHDTRTNVQVALASAGAPEWYVGLRGVASIVEAHTLVPVAKGLLR